MAARVVRDTGSGLRTRRRTKALRSLHVRLQGIPINAVITEILQSVELERVGLGVGETVDTCGAPKHSSGSDFGDLVVCVGLRYRLVLPVSPSVKFLLILTRI